MEIKTERKGLLVGIVGEVIMTVKMVKKHLQFCEKLSMLCVEDCVDVDCFVYLCSVQY